MSEILLLIRSNALSELEKFSTQDLEGDVFSSITGHMDAIHTALSFNRSQMVDYLIDRSVNLNSKGLFGESIVHILVMKIINAKSDSNLRSIWILILQKSLERGANPNIGDSNNRFALSDAKMFQDIQLCDILEKHGAISR
ncbi:MAG: hypothetical protein N4A49_16660 [Marinifilaceae bacterium]|jgi:ankyrin repeat protein|nr:hypothetical protein [Marinifilaceae bacterium]